MAISVNTAGAVSSSVFPTVSPKEASNPTAIAGERAEKGEQLKKDKASPKLDSSEVTAEKANENLEKIKQEIKKSPVLPSSEKIAAKYGITTDQAEKILSEICMEIATEGGGSPEQVTKTANGMYLMAELSDSEIFETVDIEKLLKGSAEEEKTSDKEGLSAQQIAEKYEITLEQAQEIINKTEKDKENNSSATATVADLSAKPNYSLSGSSISLDKGSTLALSTVSFSA